MNEKSSLKNAVSDSWLLLTDLQHLDIPINRSEPLHCAYTLISKTKDIYIFLPSFTVMLCIINKAMLLQ